MSSFVQLIRNKVPNDVFTDREVKMVLDRATPASRYNKIKRALASGDLLSLKRGVYAFSEDKRRSGLNLFEVSHLLYSPSYISLESALSYFGLIPERVSAVTSVTTKAGVSFRTQFALFTYERLPMESYQRGFKRIEEGGHAFLIANPLKAVLDVVFLRRKNYARLNDAEKDLRLDLRQLKAEISYLSNAELAEYKQLYKSETIKNFIDFLVWELR